MVNQLEFTNSNSESERLELQFIWETVEKIARRILYVAGDPTTTIKPETLRKRRYRAKVKERWQ